MRKNHHLETFRLKEFVVVLKALKRNNVEPRYNEGPRDWQNLFAVSRFRYFEVLFYIFYYYWVEENLFLYRGHRYVEINNNNNNNNNNNFINLLKKAFQLNLQCQISKT